MNHFKFAAPTAAALLVLAGCAAPGHNHAGMHKGPSAMAALTPTQGNSARGTVMFHQMDGQLMVHAKISGLKPNGEHGFHVHEKGDCSSGDGMSTGGHFNPDAKPHGPQHAAHHTGDLPSLKADANGNADQKFILTGPSLAAGPASIVGRGLIVHVGPDDYTTQPTGNSGARIACGVVAMQS